MSHIHTPDDPNYPGKNLKMDVHSIGTQQGFSVQTQEGSWLYGEKKRLGDRQESGKTGQDSSSQNEKKGRRGCEEAGVEVGRSGVQGRNEIHLPPRRSYPSGIFEFQSISSYITLRILTFTHT